MRNTKYVAAAFLVCGLSYGASVLGTPRPATDVPLAFQGEVMDSVCARAGSHADAENAKGIANSRDCILDCVKDGAKLVLRNHETKVVYGLDTGGPIFDQDRLMEFAGARVKIIGSLNENTGLIWHIQSIQRL